MIEFHEHLLNLQIFVAIVTDKVVESVPCAVDEPLPNVPQLVAQIAPAPPVEVVPETPVKFIENPVVDAPYPAPLPFATHYGEPVVPIQYLLLNNSI